MLVGVFEFLLLNRGLNLTQIVQIAHFGICSPFRTHHMEHLSILTGGEDHLGLEAGLEEEAMSRHRAASATARGGEGMRTDVSVSNRDTVHPHWGGNLLLALAV